MPRIVPVFLALSACGGGIPDPTGIWLFDTPTQSSDPTCTDQVTENYTNADPTVDDSTPSEDPWTYETTYQFSDTLEFAQIQTTADDGAVMIMSQTVLPGVWDDSALAWVFTWTDVSGETDTEDNVNDYAYSVASSATSTLSIALTFDGGLATGDGRYSSSDRTAWTESDLWDARSVELSDGQTPAYYYLTSLDDSGNVYNDPDTADCDSANCMLTVATTCSMSSSLSATRTDYKDEESYAHLGDVTTSGG